MTPAPASRLPAPILLAPVFRALADPTRLRILRLLLQGPLCVGDLVSVLDLPQPKVSRHLASLRQAGLVEDEKRGLWCFYRLAPARPGPHQKILEVLDRGSAEIAGAAADDRALRSLRSKGGCCPQHQRGARRRP
jgi:ArsR family transcriptional regulator, arsenate/arsenite/antimonite-responsive transcriptional repressor